MVKYTIEKVILGSKFEAMIGKPLSEFYSPKELELAMEKKLGRELKAIDVNQAFQKRARKLILESERLTKD